MSMDGLSLYSAMNELNKRLAGGKIDKIQQTDKEELLLMVRSLGQTYRLLINASAADNRVQLTELKSRPRAKRQCSACCLGSALPAAK